MAERPISLVDHTDEEETPTRQPPQRPETPTPESHIDVLYENQRGWFIFGIPLFSSKALWNLRIDQAAWVDAKYKPSAVNITNAQVPDPSWKWEWKTWYVDMSRDVDEEGWQYSFWFRGAAWHGNHPWFHSFVRRRRWLRKRVKQKLPPKTDARERMFGETFSIPTTLMRTSTIGTNNALSMGQGRNTGESMDEEISNIGTLMRLLKKAAIDREKIVLITRFVDEAGEEELHYLPEQMPKIMGMLIFQASRRQLLAYLMDTFDTAKDRRQKQNGQAQSDVEKRRIDDLQRAVDAADEECKKLEYWSDIRKLADEGAAGRAMDPANGWDDKWAGLDKSGPPHP
ncbi:hypothetical protein M011DRAFT_496116 [Sporormia fimetaria CBS 119925]|uniref:Peroxin/Ferlin domain-containing protein n=1 Tax=Sporormia fimetaria CBS 119925 TaxID=1340428 RepID=A0A6A6V4Q9_9PLEO|nr:hypothetical protein M011DRAFT_496116 [Sporormia fimetaria CBS 119925]